MYSRILIAVDGSPTSERALRHAIGLAKGLAAALRVVHIVDMGVLPLGPELAVDIGAITKARRAAGEQILKMARETSRAGGIEAETRLVETGTPAQRIATAIADEAAAWPAELVVTGTHGRSGVQRLLLGSVAEGIVRISPVPVLLIPMH
ncbi:MAG: universal stress protein [Sulfuricaulis sp.]|uniref:universal stress protein n=1 Tax=Sulfuricaulis sp. TaxID=2003553 RepID=UPI003C46AA61